MNLEDNNFNWISRSFQQSKNCRRKNYYFFIYYIPFDALLADIRATPSEVVASRVPPLLLQRCHCWGHELKFRKCGTWGKEFFHQWHLYCSCGKCRVIRIKQTVKFENLVTVERIFIIQFWRQPTKKMSI